MTTTLRNQKWIWKLVGVLKNMFWHVSLAASFAQLTFTHKGQKVAPYDKLHMPLKKFPSEIYSRFFCMSPPIFFLDVSRMWHDDISIFWVVPNRALKFFFVFFSLFFLQEMFKIYKGLKYLRKNLFLKNHYCSVNEWLVGFLFIVSAFFNTKRTRACTLRKFHCPVSWQEAKTKMGEEGGGGILEADV